MKVSKMVKLDSVGMSFKSLDIKESIKFTNKEIGSIPFNEAFKLLE